jgi:hypothetical protein
MSSAAIDQSLWFLSSRRERAERWFAFLPKQSSGLKDRALIANQISTLSHTADSHSLGEIVCRSWDVA